METEEIPDTSDVVEEMMKENTGRHFLDSGYLYGRNFEKNQGEDLEDRPSMYVEVDEDVGEVLVQKELYHFLCDNLEYTEVSHGYTQMLHGSKKDDEKWAEAVRRVFNARPCNTATEEGCLSQDIKYLPFYIEDHATSEEFVPRPHGSFVCIRIHGGCDIRGGYTEPVVFECKGMAIANHATLTASCEGCDALWASDDGGYHWYGNRGDAEDHESHEHEGEWDLSGGAVVHESCGAAVSFY